MPVEKQRKSQIYLLIDRLNSKWVFLALTALFILFLLVFLPREATRSDLSTGGLASPDTQFIYSASDLKALISNYSELARKEYIIAKVRFDILWPIVYGLWLTSGLSIVLKGRWRKGLIFLPFIAVIFDFLENIAVSTAMATYPSPLGIALYLAPIFTGIKWLTLNLAMLIFGGVVIVKLASYILKKVSR